MNQLLDHPVPTLPPPAPRPPRSRVLKLSKQAWRLILLGVGVLFAFLLWLFYFSSVFALQSLVVEGVRLVPPAQVGDRADLGSGTPLAQINPADVEQRVMGIPQIRSVQVVREWPNTIVIKVVERREVGYIAETLTQPTPPSDGTTPASGEQPTSAVAPTSETTVYRIVDETGFAFRQVDDLSQIPTGLPAIDAVDEASRIAASQVAGALSQRLLSQIVTISADAPDNVILKTTSQATVLWGASQDNEIKARILELLLRRTDDLWIDLRYPEMPTTAYNTPQPAAPSPSPTAQPTTDGSTPSAGETSSAAPSTGAEAESIPSVPGVVPSSIAPIP